MRVICETRRLIVREWTSGAADIARRFDTYRRDEGFFEKLRNAIR